jgi:hypothetical protein
MLSAAVAHHRRTGFAGATGETIVENELTIELAPFAVARGVDTQALLEASDRVERDFLAKADGYIGRVLVRKDETAWADIVFWKSAGQASQAMQRAATSDACRSYFECMAAADHGDPGAGVTLFRSLKTYGSIAR